MKTVSRILTLTLASLSMTALAQAGTYYVSPEGNDSNDGQTLPWKTISHAVATVGAGSIVQVHAGTYNERVVITKSLTLESYPGELAAIDGGGLPMQVTAYGYGLVSISSGVSNVTVSGLDIGDFKTTSVKYVPVGVYMLGTGSNIQILKNHIHDIQNTGAYPQKMANGNCNGSPPEALGLFIGGNNGTTPLSNVTISGNELDSLITGCSESMTVNGNTQGFTITNNLVHDNSNIGIAALGGEGVAPAHDYASNGEISGNTVYNISSSSQLGKAWNVYPADCVCADGIYLDGSNTVTVERNRVFNVDWGTETTGENKGQNTSNIIVRDNLFYSNNAAGMGIGGQGNDGGASNITVVNNTFYNNDTAQQGNGTLSLGTSISGTVIFENNIVYTSSGGQTVTGKTGTSGMTFNYNLYYGGVSPFSESHSLHTNPLLVNPTATPPLNANLDTQTGSPARDAGTNLGSSMVGTLDFAGNPRVVGTIDIGAYEH